MWAAGRGGSAASCGRWASTRSASTRRATWSRRPGGAIRAAPIISLRPIANINSFISSSPKGWLKDQDGRKLHFPVDRYLEERVSWAEWAGIRIQNWHRPLSAYMAALLSSGLELRFFDEPPAIDGDAAHQRAPWFRVMEWEKA
jgi:hypothetical protein